ncbi:MAG: HepT-like ribonuclease domain-containing protein [Sporichthyaceae bacterium]
MSRQDADRLRDILAAITAIGAHVARGDLSDGLIFDAVRARLMEIGEAVKDIDASVLATQPTIPWRSIAAMRDRLAHRYFDTSHAIVGQTVQDDLPALRAAIQAMLTALDTRDPG